jgi:predicted adenylyl cyclase CyaB
MEIELRAKIKNFKPVEKKLRELGAEYIGEKTENDQYFSSIELNKKLGYSFLLRIRERGGKCILTAKSAKKNMDGVWEEYEVLISEPKVYLDIFNLIGLEKVITVSKRRKTFKLDGLTVNIDKFKKWGSFAEIELISRKYGNKDRLLDVVKKLGISDRDVLNKGYITFFLKEIGSPFAKYIKN